MYLRPQVHFLSKPGSTVALFCLAEGLSYDIVAVLPELLVGINDCAPGFSKSTTLAILHFFFRREK
ncbi:hypothetical protein E4X16_21380 [Salmonella enterica]|nr:hypothetical protein [Salmonella enterica]EDD9120345.1 hypothetical protein [Salmonella enterica subsp. enterica serovar Enteritidis]EAV4799051.1 hypothetical protein [Salmonella enterica]EBB1875803.1 hypothetical protein [Salmonella enterica]EBE0443741.1 hypothetical protein [Salmonella enterica]